MDIFLELALVLVVAAIVTGIMRLFKQPLVIGYILTGIILGPLVLNVQGAEEVIDVFAKFGIAVLLFIVGLHLSPKVIKELGGIALVAGAAQITLTTIAGFFIMLILGVSVVESAYIGVALSFSSTIVVLKLLGDKGELNKLHGRLAIGVLLLQDVVASVLLIVVAASSAFSSGSPLIAIAILVFKASLVLLAMYIIASYHVPRLAFFSAQSQEYLLLFSLAWGIGFAALFYILGFSIEIGALLAGVMLSTTPYALDVSAKLRPIRDLFVAIFFIALGRSLVIEDPATLFFRVLFVSLFAIVGGSLIMYLVLRVLHYSRRTSFLVGITLAQVSEFSLILLAVGKEAGHVSSDVISLMTIVAVISIIVSSYLIMQAHRLYPAMGKFLSLFSFFDEGIEVETVGEKYDAILFGYHRAGSYFVDSFRKKNLSYVVIDFDPVSIKRMQSEQIIHRYGDVADTEFLLEISIHEASLIVSTVPDLDSNKILIRFVRSENKSSTVVVIASNVKDALELYECGASYVLMPHYVGLYEGARMVGKFYGDKKYVKQVRDENKEMLGKLLY